MGVPESVERLVERFHDNRDELKRIDYGETEVRVQFIDPLFEALGWDVRNTRGRSLGDMDVVHEDAVKVGTAHKAPDYGFYAGRERRFFVEAKKPSVNLQRDPMPAFQLRRYAWSAKLPVSVLTDFEELAIYDSRVQPVQNDSAAVARLRHITYDNFVDRWDEIAGLFSREAVYEGSIDRWVDKQSSPRGKETVDRAFLAEIERWRERLAQSIALHNPELTQRELNYAVQMTVDRILFLRMAEDRQIEEYGRLLALTNGGDIYARLQAIFREADERYNSGLFHFHSERGRPEQPDDLTPRLTIDDRTLRDIFRNLYYPNSPYEFSVLPVDVLGQVYEQFLGKVITLDSHRAVEIEDKPEVRKAGGVYYTPTYIVDYIVEHTVGKLLEGKSPRQAEKLTILDPACGSGSFLIGAYQFLLTWHRDHYLADGPAKHAKKLYQAVGGEWRLTTDERKKILINNIYGVDIDPQAVEVTKLSLMLKLLEGETSQTLNRQLSFLRERVLPDMGSNIKCGNSLIGPDFYDNQQMTLLPTEDQYRINVFDWDAEFPEIMKQGGFDAVIGNPPYLNIRLLTQIQRQEVKEYFQSHYTSAHGGYDLYVLFLERAVALLSSDRLMGMIVPNKLATLSYASEIRRLLLERSTILNIADVSELSVFGGVGVYPYIVIAEKGKPSKEHMITIIHPESPEGLKKPLKYAQPILQSSLSPAIGLAIHGEFDIESRVLTSSLNMLAKLHSGTTGFSAQIVAGHLREYAEINQGASFEFIVTGNIDRYNINLGNVRFMKRSFTKPVLPADGSDLTVNKLRLYEGSKIVIGGMTKRVEAAWDSGGLALGVQVFAAAELKNDHRYLLGILNSLLMTYIFRLRFRAKHLAGGYLAINKGQLSQLPIRTIDFTNPVDVALHDQMISLVERMLALNEQVQEARTSHDKAMRQRQIDRTDRQIDRLVYDLYGLTDDEIAIVETDS